MEEFRLAMEYQEYQQNLRNMQIANGILTGQNGQIQLNQIQGGNYNNNNNDEQNENQIPRFVGGGNNIVRKNIFQEGDSQEQGDERFENGQEGNYVGLQTEAASRDLYSEN